MLVYSSALLIQLKACVGNFTNRFSKRSTRTSVVLGPTRHAGKVIVLVKYNRITYLIMILLRTKNTMILVNVMRITYLIMILVHVMRITYLIMILLRTKNTMIIVNVMRVTYLIITLLNVM